MRVTNKLMADTVTGNLFKNIDQFLKTQNILSSGKRINKPSDDPIGMGKVLDYRKTLCAIDQYNRNIAHGESWLNVTDSTLDTIGDSLIRAKELALSQANATANADTMKVVAEEIKNIYDHILQLANTKLGNSYIFAGHKTDTPPFSRDDDYIASYNGEAEVTDITCIADIAGSLDGKYLTLSSPSTDYYVWYNVDDNSAEPAVADRIGIEVNIASGALASVVADKTAAAIKNIVGLGAELSDDKVTVTNAAAGDVVNSVDNDSGFSITTITQGTDGDKNKISIIAGENLEIDINVNGDEIFLSDLNIFEVLRELKVALETNDSDGEAGVTDITCSTPAGLGGEYFTLSSPSTDYYVWYNEGGSTDPEVPDRIGIEVDIGTVNLSDEVASNTADAINNIVGLGAVSSGDKVTVTNAAAGAVTNAYDYTSVPGFSLDITTQGTDGNKISDQLGPLDDALDQILKAMANVGTKLNRLEATENHWADFKLNITQMLSDTEDADMIKTVTDLASQEAAYQASLAASARIIQPSLIDFLR
ncbi:MAG: flagellar hook-associated protein FlgL [Gammaproteobacteria bacterium]